MDRRWPLAVALMLLAPGLAWAQRIQFPSPVGPDSPFYSPPQYASPAAAAPAAPPVNVPTFNQPPEIPPSLTPPSSAPSGVVPAGASAPWDPYAADAAATAAPAAESPLYPAGGYLQPGGSTQQAQKLIHQIGMEQAWLARLQGQDSLGLQTIDLWVTGALPFLWNPSPLLITPGFTFHFWDGPDSVNVPQHPDLPPRTYDAYLDAAWKPRINDFVSADLDVRVGVYSDFNRVNSDSIRITGRGLAVLSFSPTFQLALGVVYVNRGNVKILPAGGVIYRPNSDLRADLVFPNPKLAYRFRTIGNSDLWWYVTGRYGGGFWTISRSSGLADRVTYNDIRIAGGLELYTIKGTHAWVDVGYIWDREVIYVSNAGSFTPDDTVGITAGITF